MKNLFLAAVVCSLLAAPAFAAKDRQQAATPAAQSTDKTAPSYDLKPQALLDFDAPHKKYSYRPPEGVRSTGEVFLHIALANYNIPSLMGPPLPAGFDAKTFE